MFNATLLYELHSLVSLTECNLFFLCVNYTNATNLPNTGCCVHPYWVLREGRKEFARKFLVHVG